LTMRGEAFALLICAEGGVDVEEVGDVEARGEEETTNGINVVGKEI